MNNLAQDETPTSVVYLYRLPRQVDKSVIIADKLGSVDSVKCDCVESDTVGRQGVRGRGLMSQSV